MLAQHALRTVLLLFSHILKASISCIALAGSVAMANQAVLHVVMPASAGSPGDVVVRQAAPDLERLLGRTIVVDYAPGAAGAIGARQMLSSPRSEDHVFSGDTSSLITGPLSNKTSGYKPKDFRLVSVLGETSFGLFVPAASELTSIKDMRRRRDVPLTYGTLGVGSVSHLVGEALRQQLQVEARDVPYKTFTQQQQDLISGHIDFAFMPFTVALRSHVSSGRLRVLAITADRRHPAAPDAPTMAESGVEDFIFSTWVALAVPASASEEFASRLNASGNLVLTKGEMPRLMREAGGIPSNPRSLKEISEFHRREISRYERLLMSLHIVPE